MEHNLDGIYIVPYLRAFIEQFDYLDAKNPDNKIECLESISDMDRIWAPWRMDYIESSQTWLCFCEKSIKKG